MSSPTIPDPRVEAVVHQLLDAEIYPEHLDEVVTNSASERASNINNAGLYEQVRFLMYGGDNAWTPEEVISAAKAAKEEDGESNTQSAE